MNLQMRVAWLGASGLVCSLASLGVLGWPSVLGMFVGALVVGQDE